MTATASPRPVAARSTGRLRAVLLVAAAALVAVLANSVIATAAIAAGAGAFPALGPTAFVPATIIGVALATLGWFVVTRVASRPARLLRVLVPVLAVLSFTPDVMLAVTGFIPGTTPTAVVALMLMHVVVVAVSALTLIRAIPPRDAR